MTESNDSRNGGTQTQLARFAQAAREAECDEDKAAWEAKLRKIAKQKPKQPD